MSATLRMVLLLLAAPLAHGQDAAAPPAAPQDTAQPDAPPPQLAVARPATVNGVSITAADVALQLKLLSRELQRVDPASREHIARRRVAEEILMAAEVIRLNVELSEREVDTWWKERTGQTPDYAAQAAATGTTVERQRDLARRAALADLYLLHRCGLRGEMGARIPPDPLLVRVITITPSQLREAFIQNRALFDRPEIVNCDVWTLADEPALQAAQAALEAGGRPEAEVMQRQLPLPDARRVFPAEIADWLDQSHVGDHRALDTRTLLLVTGREPAVPALFADVQQTLRNLLLDELLREARQHLVDGLRDHATYWPPDLFAAPKPPDDKRDAMSEPPIGPPPPPPDPNPDLVPDTAPDPVPAVPKR
jgi:hypothetical protein